MAESQWTIHVKHGSQSLELQIDANSKVSDLHERLQTLTGAFVRKQKLIHKGKVCLGGESFKGERTGTGLGWAGQDTEDRGGLGLL
mgnify:CR=1 FL=1